MTIQQVTADLRQVNEVLSKYTSDTNIPFEDGLILAKFYGLYKNINALIEYAESVAISNDAKSLSEEAQALLDAASVFKAIYAKGESVFTSYNPKPSCDKHIEPFVAKYNEDKEFATQLWKQYSDASTRLDYMNASSSEYMLLDAECTALKSKYDEAKSISDASHQTMVNERQVVAQLYYLELMYIEVLVERLERIANSIITDIGNLTLESKLC